MMKSCLSVLLFLGIALSSCGRLNKKEPKPPQQVLRVNIFSEPPTMDPRKGSEVIGSFFHFLLFEGLTRLNPDGSIRLAQAERFDLSQDKKRYTFHLRESLWSDGTLVTAYDFEKSWKDILDPRFPAANAQLFYPIKNANAAKKGLVPLSEVGIRALDERTLFVELDHPTPYFLELISFCVFFPVNHRIDETDPRWAYNTGPLFTSNGYFVLKKWRHHGEIVLEKNPRYWNPKGVHLDEIRVSMVDNETTVLQMFEKGELDIVGQFLSPLPIDALPKLKAAGRLNVYPTSGTTFCAFNTATFPFSNKNLRKAFAYAMDRSEIVSNITQLDEIPALGAIPPILKKNRNRAFFKDHDAKGAKEFLEQGLKELGVKAEELHLTYLYSTSELEHKVAQALQQQWQKTLGIHVHLENSDHKILLDRLTKRNYMMAQTLWYAQYNDQMNLLERYKHKENVKNYAGWENLKFVSLLDLSFLAEDPKERLRILEQAEEIFMDELPIAPIFHKNAIHLLNPSIKHAAFTPIGNLCYEQLALDQDSKERSKR